MRPSVVACAAQTTARPIGRPKGKKAGPMICRRQRRRPSLRRGMRTSSVMDPASKLHVLSSMATRRLLGDLIGRFEATSPVRVSLESVGGVDAARRVRSGDVLDVGVLAGEAIDQLIADGRIVAGSRVDLVRSPVAVAVRVGEPHPDISSMDAVKRAVLGARSVGYSTGPSGTHLAKLFATWDDTGALQARVVVATPGVPVGSLVAEGEVELGFQQLSELMTLDGI